MEGLGASVRADRRVRVVGFLALGAGLALLGVLAVRSGIWSIATALSRLGFWGLAIVALAHLPVIALMGTAWWLIARTSGGTGRINFVWARAVRDAASEALPFSQVGGYVIGARALTVAGADGTLAAASTLIDLVVELSAKLPYLLIGLAVLQWLHPSRAALLTISAVILALVLFMMLVCSLQARAEKLAPKLVTRIVRRWPGLQSSRERLMNAFAIVGRTRAIQEGFGLHFLCWAAGAAETWLAFHLIHIRVSFGVALIIDSLVGAIRAVAFFVPGAIGIQEGGYVLLCGLFGLAPGIALALSLIRRARDILIAIPILISWKYREAAALLGEQKPSRS